MSKEKAVFVAARPLVNGWGFLEEHSNGGLYVGVANGDAGIGNENSGGALDWRSFDRSVFASPQTPANIQLQAHWFQRNQIQSITLGGAYASVHTVAGMQNVLDYGVHTGLYSVPDEQGRLYLCGLYPGINAGEMGWVKLDAVTGVWTSGIVTGLIRPTGNRMGPCVNYEGQLVHATNGVASFFDPVEETIWQRAYGNGSLVDRPVISTGRLYIVSAGGGAIRVHGLFFGSFVENLNLGSHSISFANGGSFGLLRYGGSDDHNLFFVMYYTTSGGTGSRCFVVNTTAGGVPTTTERTTMVPTGAPLTHGGIGGWPYTPITFENLAYPGGTAHPNYSWESCFDNVDTPPYAPSVNAPWGHCKLIRYPYTGLVPLNTYGGVQFIFNGELIALSDAGTTGAPPGGFTGIELLGELSISSQWNGGDDTRNNQGRAKWWPISATSYSDGTTPRGMLVTFWGQSGGSPAVYNTVILYGRRGQRPNVVATLVPGSPAVSPGGTASYNGALNRIEDCDPSDTFFTTLVHGAVTGGPFNVGATLQGGSSGATAVVNYAAATGAYVTSILGGPFTPTEVITQINGANVGAFATLTTQEDAVTHQAVWDLDADGIPDDEFVTIQPLAFVASAFPASNPTGDDVTYSGYTLTVPAGFEPATEPDSSGPVSTPLTNFLSGTAISAGPAVETLADTLAGAESSAGPVSEVSPEGDYPPNLYARVPARAHSQPGWINLQVDGVDTGGDQPTANLLDSASDSSVPVGRQSGVAPAHNAVLKLLLGTAVSPQPGALISTEVDLAAPGDTVIWTVPAGSPPAVIFGASIRCEAAVAITIPATAQIGFDAGVANLFSSQLLVNLKLPDDAYDYPVGGESVIVPAGSVISLRVTAAAAGTSQLAKAILFGYLL